MEPAQQLAQWLIAHDQKVVFAESCTAGLLAAALGEIPGISAHLCGSAVTYRERTKIDWLRVERQAIERFTAVSEQVAAQMALGVLSNTTEADLAASVTGHLGPDAPAGFDGVVFVGIARRDAAEVQLLRVAKHHLAAQGRLQRRNETVRLVLTELLRAARELSA